jgi:hypothetical protein
MIMLTLSDNSIAKMIWYKKIIAKAYSKLVEICKKEEEICEVNFKGEVYHKIQST